MRHSVVLGLAVFLLATPLVQADIRPFPQEDFQSSRANTGGWMATILAGLALTLAGVTAGICYARRRDVGARLPVVIALVITVGFALRAPLPVVLGLTVFVLAMGLVRDATRLLQPLR